MSSGYQEFLSSRTLSALRTGPDVPSTAIHSCLFPFQRDLVRWAVRKGRAALFADTGMGKTFMQIEWARLLGERTLIVAPLSVARQTVDEGRKIDVPVTYVRDQSDVGESGLYVTNYEMVNHFDAAAFGAVVLDESSLLKALAGKTRQRLTEMFAATPYRLCCTATPAPNDIAEIANHSEFLGIMNRADMLATFFVHDDCFAGDTLVDTPGGPRPIENLCVGDQVLNPSGIDIVTATAKRCVTALIEVCMRGEHVFCSFNHLWLTRQGWRKAIELKEGDELVTEPAAVRMVREGFCRSHPEDGTPERSFLRSVLLGEMAHDATQNPRSGLQRDNPTEAQSCNAGLFRIGQPGGRSAQRSGPQFPAINTAGHWREDQCHDASTRDQGGAAFFPWDPRSATRRQWTRADSRAGGIVEGTRIAMGGRGHYLVGPPRARIPQLLPCGPSASEGCFGSGDRRPVTLQRDSETERPQKGHLPGFARVERVAVHEPGSSAFNRHSGGDDTVTLYDLTIRSHPSFSVAGVIVHNCGWRLKGHAQQAFYRWMASWGMSIRRPSDLGYEDDGFVLPPLRITPHSIPTGYRPADSLFFLGLKGIQDRSAARRWTTEARVAALAERVNAQSGQWLVWCGLNAEATQAAAAIPDAVEVTGSNTIEQKQTAIEAFQGGRIRVLVTKPKIAGYGLNLQQCHQVAFLGLNDSWETYYQCIRRCWRFGQREEVDVDVIVSDVEQEVWVNVQQKEEEAQRMTEQLIQHVQQFERAELYEQQADTYAYETATIEMEDYRLMLGDSVERMAEVADQSVDLSIFSPPFLSLYTYSPTPRDLGNARTPEEFAIHFGYIIDHLRRITKPGRLCAVHVAQVPAMLVRDGYIGLKDFRGHTINLFEARDWIYHGEVCIDKDPQAQAIRIKAKALLFSQLRRDASWLRPAMADYILVFRAPGDNAVPILPDISNDQWISWARPIWYGINETETLNAGEGREYGDERHICPLQLGVIERVVRLWSNPGEVICSPFMGIGSEGYQALKLGRRFVGCELKQSYFQAACRNIARVSRLAPKQLDLLKTVAPT